MDKPDFQDRRTFERFYLKLPLSYFWAEHSVENYVYTHDISAEGMGITAEEEITLGMKMSLTLKVPQINKLLPAYGKVIWVKKIGGSFRVGILLEHTEIMEISAALRFLNNAVLKK